MKSKLLTEIGLGHILLYEDGSVINVLTKQEYTRQKNTNQCIIKVNGKFVRFSRRLLCNKYFHNEILEYPYSDKRNLAFCGYHGYTITRDGKIWNNTTYEWMKQRVGTTGYWMIGLTRSNGITKTCRVHRLMALAFIPNPENKPFINHKDGNKLNNHLTNLEWCTNSENIQHAYDSGMMSQHHTRILPNAVVVTICELLVEDTLSDQDIAKEVGIDQRLVTNIRVRKNYTEISENYSFPDRNKFEYRYKYSVFGGKEKIIEACRLIEDGLQNAEIAEKLGVSRSSIRDIRSGKMYPEISAKYDMRPSSRTIVSD